MLHSTDLEGVLGIDLSDKKFDYCLLGLDGDVQDVGGVPLTEKSLRTLLGQYGHLRVVLEVGTHSPWVSRVSEELGHETLVANPRALPAIYASQKKNDQADAEQLARLGRVDPKLLSPIRHRGPRAQADLAQIRSRDALVSARTALVNHVRGSVKSFGHRLSRCSTPSFHSKVRDDIPEELLPALGPVLESIDRLTTQIRSFDRAIEKQGALNYPETERLRQVKGVGVLTALAYVLVLEDPQRFPRSRRVGAFLGLTPKQDDSGESQKQLRITKHGDRLLRRLLVGSAHYILGPFGEECDLRTWGLELTRRGGKNAKKRAVVAVARRLSVLLHSLWRTGEEYDPFRQSNRRKAAV